MDIGWIVAGVLALVCVWLLWVVEKAYSTGIIVGRTEALKEQTDRMVRDAADRMGRAIG